MEQETLLEKFAEEVTDISFEGEWTWVPVAVPTSTNAASPTTEYSRPTEATED
ncbi:MAG: hypothetical protein NTX72_00090 [Candidatus Uhrbacteria bacterium]|nr:hypothetical protein [Candidatus Uhrbacteria bacterium]